jgi:2-polyprenyl-6-methoxyphenol hydroxylase-like FAD-dependent oxidoreductase
MSQPDHDVVIVGAGLVGLALAAALARSDLSVAIVDRNTIASAPVDAAYADTWDSRVYAVSPGSAEFLHGQGVWQRIPAERISADRRDGDLRRRSRSCFLRRVRSGRAIARVDRGKP